MSKMAKDLSKFGLEAKKAAPAKAKKSLATVDAPAKIVGAVDAMIKANQEKAQAEAKLAECQNTIREFSFEQVLKTKDMDNFQIEGSTGAVNVVFKDQYTMKDRAPLDALLKKYKKNPEDYIEEKTALKFDYDGMSDDEKKKLFGFLSKEFGAERFKALVTEETKFAIKGLKDEMPVLAKDRAALDEIRQASGQHAPTVVVRLEKE